MIGGGAMGGALIGGLLAHSEVEPSAVRVAEALPERRAALATEYGVGVTDDAADAVAGADVVVIATKPHDVESACAALGDGLDADAVVVSIAAGVPTAALESRLPADTRVVRAMPNTPGLVGQAMSVICAGAAADEAALVVAEGVLGAIGRVVRLDESAMDAVTAVSGSGPAYVFLVAELMVDAAQQVGLSADVATILVENTIAGAAKLLLASDRPPADLRAQVTSPGGTTAAALEVLDEQGLGSAFADAIRAATERSAELGKQV